MQGLVHLLDALARWLDQLIFAFNNQFPESSFFSYSWNVRALLALVLVSVCCGAVGSLVVGGRMAFFSDALAHCAFAGVSIGFLLFEAFRPPFAFWAYVTPIMVVFGMAIGAGIAFVRARSGLASDTVIGVFFAAAIGLAALIRKLIVSRNLFSLEDFLFGDPMLATAHDLLALAALVLVTLGILALTYNYLLLASFNNSLALSRRVPVRVANYAFIVLLALIVNLCLRSVGVLLINALMVVPAATGVNICRNLRQLFWFTIAFCLGVSMLGLGASWELGTRYRVELGIPGAIVLLCVGFFVLSLVLGPLWKNRRAVRPQDRLAKTAG